jgi:MoxR-like ATPase
MIMTTLQQDAPATEAGPDQEAIDKLAAACQEMRQELGKVIVGQEDVVEQLLTVIIARGHALLEGVPGLAKTLLISTLSDCMDLTFRRVQFTPDLMPADILGSEILQDDPETGRRMFKFVKGPIFTNVLLADEINRTPPKTQAALLEAMQERKVSNGGQDMKLDPPFFVLATQNPVDQEGTYPLPEAQLDRFLYKIQVDYPTKDEEVRIVQQVAQGGGERPNSVLSREDVIAAQNAVRKIVVPETVVNYATDLVRATRIRGEDAPKAAKELLAWGAGPRASISLVVAAKVRAALNGRYHVAIEDIKSIAHPILRHRIVPNFTAQAKGLSADDVIDQIIDATPVA